VVGSVDFDALEMDERRDIYVYICCEICEGASLMGSVEEWMQKMESELGF
jgi:hypothetical protein